MIRRVAAFAPLVWANKRFVELISLRVSIVFMGLLRHIEFGMACCVVGG